MNQTVLKDRFKNWAISTIHFLRKLPSNPEFKVVRYQLIKSSSSSAANYRAACRGKSTADFVNKLKIVEEELDERLFWFEFIEGISDDFNLEIQPLFKEGDELLSIYCRFNKNYQFE
jgi:four helix bundle protein